MRILAIGQNIKHDTLNITSIEESMLSYQPNMEDFSYIIISGGDGTIRRVVKILHTMKHNAHFILNPTGSFNVIAKLHRVPSLDKVLAQLSNAEVPNHQAHSYYSLNDEVFLFSAGNMGDLQHIFLAETLRFGILKKGIAKYILAGLFLLPVHLIMTPFMLLSPRRFLILTPAKFIKKFGSFYGRVEEEIQIDLENHYNLIELDGDVVTVKESRLTIKSEGHIDIIVH